MSYTSLNTARFLSLKEVRSLHTIASEQKIVFHQRRWNAWQKYYHYLHNTQYQCITIFGINKMKNRKSHPFWRQDATASLSHTETPGKELLKLLIFSAASSELQSSCSARVFAPIPQRIPQTNLFVCSLSWELTADSCCPVHFAANMVKTSPSGLLRSSIKEESLEK